MQGHHLDGFPYQSQQYNYDCGPAIVRMITKYFNIETEYETLIELLIENKGTTCAHTPKRRMRRVLSDLNLIPVEFALVGPTSEQDHFYTLLERHCSRVVEVLDKCFPVVLNYNKGGQGHYAVAYDYDENSFIVHCPEDGPGQHIPFSYLEKEWRSGNRRWEKWFMGVFQ